MAKYFGTNGIRGLFNELNPELVFKIAQAFGIWCKNGKILIGRDMRLTGECLLYAVKSGLASVGCEVVDLGICSAPAGEFILKNENASGLIMITASHNPAEWNALKFVDKNGITVSKERGEEIEKILEKFSCVQLAKWNEIKPMKEFNYATQEHIKAIEGIINFEKIKKAQLRIALDFGNGTSALYIEMFKRVAKITPINSHLDGNFPARPSEPSEENIINLINLVKQGGYDCGFAWDADGDRLVAVDEKGNFVIGDKIFALSVLLKLKNTHQYERKDHTANSLRISQSFTTSQNGSQQTAKYQTRFVNGKKIVTTIATSRSVEDIAKKEDAQTIYTKIGAPYLSEAMFKENAEIGGEEVGGVIWKEVSLAKDGITTAMKIIEAVAEKPFSEWLREIPLYYNAKIKILVKKERKTEIMQKFARMHEKKNINTLDGVRINFPDSWIIVRASGTENYVRIFAEATTKEKAKKLINEYAKKLNLLL